jgi:DNA-binding Xre family transcriptional regulator
MSKLKELIQKSGMGQIAVAKAAGVDPSMLSIYVNQPERLRSAKVETLIKICDILSCNPIEIIEGAFWAKEEWDNMKHMELYTAAELQGVFTGPEKHYLCDMLNGSLYVYRVHPKEYLKIQIIDANAYDGLGSKWGVQVNEFVKKIDSLTTHQAYMVIKIISEFWESISQGKQIDINSLFGGEK